MKQLWFLFLIFLPGGTLRSQENRAQSADTISVEAPLDQGAFQPRYPTADRLNDFRKDRSYNYEQDAPPPQNPLARFWYWLQRLLVDFFKSNSYQNFWQYVILAGLGGLIVWLLYKAEFLGGLFGRKAKEDPLAYHRLTENIHELDFNRLIDEATEQHHYRLAIRLYYLKILKQLTDKQLIHWQPTKTNRMYVNELENVALKKDFEQLTSQFEYVWYGEFQVTTVEFNVLKEQFQFFSGKI
ncbi:MAG: DUF4129 domain-containing protein [Spirosomataceae bacterium]